MRTILFLFALRAITIQAQPLPDLSVVFVEADGRPLRGAYAHPVAAQAWLSGPGAPAWTVEMHFTVSDDYPYSPYEIGKHQGWPLQPDTVRDGRTRHLRFRVLDGYCTDQFVLVIRGGDTMRVDMPNDRTVRGHLHMFTVKRSGNVPSPEVIRFRPGRYSFVALAQESEVHALELRLAVRLVREADKAGRRGSARDPVRAVAEDVPSRPVVMRKVELEALHGDTAVLRFWGNVMLTGACGGIMPLMAMEVVGRDGWEDHVPLPEVQMDCGPLSEEANGHELRIPLVEWVQAHGRAALPGRYRLRFRFADGAVRHTRAFVLE